MRHRLAYVVLFLYFICAFILASVPDVVLIVFLSRDSSA